MEVEGGHLTTIIALPQVLGMTSVSAISKIRMVALDGCIPTGEGVGWSESFNKGTDRSVPVRGYSYDLGEIA